MLLLVIDPNTAGTSFVWILLLLFLVGVGYAVYQSNKSARQTVKK